MNSYDFLLDLGIYLTVYVVFHLGIPALIEHLEIRKIEKNKLANIKVKQIFNEINGKQAGKQNRWIYNFLEVSPAPYVCH